jgi:hypothetical protein
LDGSLSNMAMRAYTGPLLWLRASWVECSPRAKVSS